jgi:hypothetical protein
LSLSFGPTPLRVAIGSDATSILFNAAADERRSTQITTHSVLAF